MYKIEAIRADFYACRNFGCWLCYGQIKKFESGEHLLVSYLSLSWETLTIRKFPMEMSEKKLPANDSKFLVSSKMRKFCRKILSLPEKKAAAN